MKQYLNKFYIYTKNSDKKRATFNSSFSDIDSAIDEANNLYTGEQEITIKQAWQNTTGHTGEDTILTYHQIKKEV